MDRVKDWVGDYWKWAVGIAFVAYLVGPGPVKTAAVVLLVVAIVAWLAVLIGGTVFYSAKGARKRATRK